MHRARAFFFVWAGIPCLALALLATPPSARAEPVGDFETPLPTLDAEITRQPSLSAQQATPSSSAPTMAIASPGDVSPAILRACQRINGQDLLRIQGDFGRFQGHVSQTGPRGLDGLRTHPTEGAAAAPPGLVTWDRIDRVERRVGSSGWGALVGGLVLGSIGALAGSVSASFDNPDLASGEAAIGAGVGAAIGAGLGALIGAAIPRWHVEYEAVRPPGVPPTIAAITPLNQTVSAGSSGAITVTATGTGPLAYRWFRNGLPLDERKDPTISFAPARTGDSGAYFCVVTNGFGTATSAVATLKVTATAE